MRFLYILYISVDGNFKLKGKDRGLKDVELMPGWGPFVEESTYQAFIADYVDQPEVSFLISPFLSTEKLSHRSTHVSPSTMRLSVRRRAVHLVMLSRAPLLLSAQGMHLYEETGQVTCRKARSMYSQ